MAALPKPQPWATSPTPGYRAAAGGPGYASKWMDLVTSMMEEGYAHRDDGLENGGNIVIKRIGSQEELEKEAFRMAEGGEEGCRLARDPELQKEILEIRLPTSCRGRATSWNSRRATSNSARFRRTDLLATG
eukprot:s11474_g2.t1